MVSIDDVKAAHSRIKEQVIQTPLLSSDRLNAQLPFDLYIKAEALQRTGSFKFRGASNAILSLDKPGLPVIAYSSGNHAQAVAFAARLSGRKATIIMPQDAPIAKIEGTKSYGADVVLYDRYTQSREEIGDRLASEQSAVLIRPFDDERVIAGQGTSGLEIAHQAAELGISPSHFICCCGGGGLMAGTSIALKDQFADIALYAAEPDGFDDTAKSLQAGTAVSNDPQARSICDAIVTPAPGKLTFPILQHYGVKGLVCSDEDALHAMKIAWSYFKITAEPGGAVALACSLSQHFISQFDSTLPRKTVIAMVSGGNVDREMFEQALDMSLRY